MTGHIEFLTCAPSRLLVRVAEWGAEGWGEAVGADAAALAGEGRAAVTDLPVAAEDFLEMLDAQEASAPVRCAIAAAWLSARAAAAALPLAALLAPGRQPAMEVPLCGMIGAALPEEAAARAASLVALGCRTLVIRCGAERAADLARVAAVREAAPAARLRLDAAGAWDPVWAIEHLRALWRHDIEHVAEPIPASRPVAALAALKRASPVPIALGEGIGDLGSLARILALGVADAIQVDARRAGGADRAAAMIRAAEQAGVPVSVTSRGQGAIGTAVALHLAAILPEPAQDSAIPLDAAPDDDPAPMPVMERGAVARLPRGGGLGVAPDPAALARLCA
jgi:L-alanine-DL-glutamate epimerase-like enolase superfamily enzyme